MKKFASVTINSADCTKNITIDITDCAGLTETIDKISEKLEENKMLIPGDEMSLISFYQMDEQLNG